MLEIAAAACLGIASSVFHSLLTLILLTVAAGVCFGILGAVAILHGVSKIFSLRVRREIALYRVAADHQVQPMRKARSDVTRES